MRPRLPFLLLTLAALGTVPTVLAPRAVAQAAPRATTKNGVVEGITLASGVRTFRGIPYAAPPVRENRWRAPQPVQSWSGVRMADRFADQCMQARIYGDMMFRNSGNSEDCLYVNVWAPANARPDAALPVLFYIYGGGWAAGDGSEPRYDGESMAKRGIVVVTLSHRLGIFGYFSHPELTAESPQHASGNYGSLDQAAALRWVHDNIAAFGGDPRTVTIAGESAGSFAVSGLMASPVSRGLFARAIGESGAFFGSTIKVNSLAESEQNGVKFAQAVGATSIAALRALSATELLEASGRPGMPAFLPNIDGWFFPKDPAQIYAAGEQATVPLLAGWNSMEVPGRAILHEDPTPERVRGVLEKRFSARAAEAEKFYPVATADEAAQSIDDLASDLFLGYATWKWLDAHARTSGQPVYRYMYARPRPATVEAGVTPNLAGGVSRNGNAAPTPPARGAVHSAEIEYALGNLALNPVFAWTDDDRKVSTTMEGYFANFVKTGDPNGAGLPAWPRGDATSGQVQRIRIDVDTHAEPEPTARYRFLDQAPVSLSP
ncbi:MAG TPA: carboxylesterase family protein [Gemmatimonadaceae bacterium]|nr:carboxylesterase family protein [Gemmatimonadaceae bacterium]